MDGSFTHGGRARPLVMPRLTGASAMNPDREGWIGLVEVKPRPGVTILGGCVGAIVNALAWVSSESEYAAAVGDA